MANVGNVSDRILQGMALGKPGILPFQPAPAPAPAPFRPQDTYRPAPVPVQPAPLPVQPAPVPRPAPAPPRPAPVPPRPAPVPAVVVLPTNDPRGYGQQVLALINGHRQRARPPLPPLALRDDLDKVAHAHSQDMVSRHFFNHNNPNGQSPFARMRQAGITYTSAAENIAMGQRTPAEVVTTWMNSKGHRDNIMNPSFHHMGLGVATGAGGSLYWTQTFTN